jgi:hypothetical protein
VPVACWPADVTFIGKNTHRGCLSFKSHRTNVVHAQCTPRCAPLPAPFIPRNTTLPAFMCHIISELGCWIAPLLYIMSAPHRPSAALRGTPLCPLKSCGMRANASPGGDATADLSLPKLLGRRLCCSAPAGGSRPQHIVLEVGCADVVACSHTATRSADMDFFQQARPHQIATSATATAPYVAGPSPGDTDTARSCSCDICLTHMHAASERSMKTLERAGEGATSCAPGGL